MLILAMSLAAQLLPTSPASEAPPPTYYELPVAERYQGPSGEPGQIEVTGTVVKAISMFQGRIDDEADWHVYLNLATDDAAAIRAALPQGSRDVISRDAVQQIYSEVMVLDGWDTPVIGDDRYYTADVTLAFLLTDGQHPAAEWGRRAIDCQGEELAVPSRLVGERVYLQGVFVSDGGHDWRPEIHPLDSIAFAVGSDGAAVDVKPPGSSDERTIHWRVAFFANSSFHKVNRNLPSVRKARTTTWYLELPPIVARFPERLTEVVIEERPRRLWNSAKKRLIASRGVQSFPPATLAIDPRDGRRKLKVTATMEPPDKHGGLVIRDYLVSVEMRSMPAFFGRRAGVGTYDDKVRPQYTAPGQAVSYEITLHNQGLGTGQYRLTGWAGNESWDVRYFAANGTDITAAMTGAGHVTARLHGNVSAGPIRVIVTPAATLAFGQTRTLTLSAVQINDPTRVDTITLRTITHDGTAPEVVE